MGCTHYVLDKTKPVIVNIVCYDCGKPVDINNPSRGHEHCYGGTVGYGDNELAVDIEIKNTRER